MENLAHTRSLRAALNAWIDLTVERVREGVRSGHTLAMTRRHVRYFSHAALEIPLAVLDAEAVSSVLADCARGCRILADGSCRSLSNVTLRKRASTLRAALRLARRRGWIAAVPEFPEMPARYVPRNRALDWDEYADLLRALPQHRREWIALATWTGQRAGDVHAARREDFNPAGAWVRVRSTKTHQPAGFRIAAAPELLRILTPRWSALERGAHLVQPWPHVSSALTALTKRRGWQTITANTLRHTFFTWAVAAGGLSAEVQAIGGWTTPLMLMKVYAHAAPVRCAELVAKTAELAQSTRRPPQRVLPAIQPAEKETAGAADYSAGGEPVHEEADTGPVGAQGIEPRTKRLRVSVQPARPPAPPPFPRSQNEEANGKKKRRKK